MTLLIDPPNSPGHGRLWSHLASDTSFEELHRFASGLGIPPRGFDRDHYDIPAERYDEVVTAGATPVSSRELISRLRAAGLRRRKSVTLSPRPPGRPLVRPERLRRGDAVAVVAPAGRVPAERLAAGVDVLRSWGLAVRIGEHVQGAEPGLGYLAATDEERAADLTAAWCDPEVRAVFCARGGYGCQRIVDLLDYDALAAAGPKVLVGFSDITVLHQVFGRRLGVTTVHGPVVTSLGAAAPAADPARSHLHRLLFEPAAAVLTPDPCEVLVPGAAEGVLVGGNLALLAAQVGTPGFRSAADSLVVLEDVHEEPYRLDRLLTQLLRSGWFEGVRGVVLGAFTDCGPPDVVRALLLDRLAPLGVPVLAGAPFGHVPGHLPVPLGVPARLDGATGTLTLRMSPLL